VSEATWAKSLCPNAFPKTTTASPGALVETCPERVAAEPKRTIAFEAEIETEAAAGATAVTLPRYFLTFGSS